MNLKSTIEALLFIQGEPLAISRIAKITGQEKTNIQSALQELAAEYRERGIVLIQSDDAWQFATHPGAKAAVEKLVTSELSDDLSRASVEVLSIIAYKGPVSRADIEYIRGVNSSFIVRNLLLRGLISREENPKDRRSYLYRVSADFLKHLGLGRIEELPQYGTLREKKIELPPDGNQSVQP